MDPEGSSKTVLLKFGRAISGSKVDRCLHDACGGSRLIRESENVPCQHPRDRKRKSEINVLLSRAQS